MDNKNRLNRVEKNRLNRALKRKYLSIEELLGCDRGLDAAIDLLNSLRANRRVKHLVIIVVKKDHKLTTFSDLGLAAELLVLEKAKMLAIGSPFVERDLICNFADELLVDEEDGDEEDEDGVT